MKQRKYVPQSLTHFFKKIILTKIGLVFMNIVDLVWINLYTLKNSKYFHLISTIKYYYRKILAKFTLFHKGLFLKPPTRYFSKNLL